MIDLHVFRHGQTDWNAEGRFQGHIDIPLNERGREQAAALVPALERARIEAILSSDLSRARETAEIAARGLRVPVYEDARLREAHLGEAQGLLAREIEERFPEIARRWRTAQPTDADVAYPGGESANEIIARAVAAIGDFLRVRPLERLGISCHGGVVRRLMQAACPGRESVPIPNGVLYHLRYDPGSGRLIFSEPGRRIKVEDGA
jgi:broad specificity phosphatase PhoE